MNTKPVPVIITLAAAFISCVVSIVQRVEFSVFVTRLLIVVLIFMFMGTTIKLVLDYAFRTLEPQTAIDDEVSDITSELESEEDDEDGEGISLEEIQDSEEG